MVIVTGKQEKNIFSPEPRKTPDETEQKNAEVNLFMGFFFGSCFWLNETYFHVWVCMCLDALKCRRSINKGDNKCNTMLYDDTSQLLVCVYTVNASINFRSWNSTQWEDDQFLPYTIFFFFYIYFFHFVLKYTK